MLERELSYELNIGRVIARPFIGTEAANFTRTANRKDYAVLPPSPTLLDCLTKAGRAELAKGRQEWTQVSRAVTLILKGA